MIWNNNIFINFSISIIFSKIIYVNINYLSNIDNGNGFGFYGEHCSPLQLNQLTIKVEISFN